MRSIGRMTVSAACVGLVVVSAGLVGCGNSATNTVNHIEMEGPPEGLRTGELITVAFRPDRLGFGETPVSANAQNVGGAVIAVEGVLRSVTGSWIVLDSTSDGQRWWIRLDSVNWLRQAAPLQTDGANAEAAAAG